MNGMNKTIVMVVSTIALVYSGLCFFLTLQSFVTTEGNPIDIWIFFPLGADSLGFNLTEYLGQHIKFFADGGLYAQTIEWVAGLLPDSLADESYYLKLVMILVGFLLAVFGFMPSATRDCSGKINPAQYLWTHRPGAFMGCLAMPWGLIFGAWKAHKALVIFPILLIFLYWPWALMIDMALIIPFVLVKLAVSAKISSYAKEESKQYEKNTDFGVCPHCKRSFDRPMIKCRCGLILEYPVPNIYGYKYHTCNKGHDIPCESGKRSNLVTICPHCNSQIQTREAMPITISFVGGTNTGKTTLMLAAVQTITINARTKDVTVDAVSSGVSKDAVAAKDYAPRTIPGELESQVIFLRSMDLQDREIIFNDISGVEFQPATNKVIFEEYYNYTNGIIFTFDPLSFGRELKRETPHEVFESFHYMYTTIKGIGPGTVSDIPFAIVATKNDIHNPKLEDSDVRQFLIDKGEESFVRVVESLFTEVKYFSVCSRGDDCSSAMRPVWWIVEHADKTLAKLIPSP